MKKSIKYSIFTSFISVILLVIINRVFNFLPWSLIWIKSWNIIIYKPINGLPLSILPAIFISGFIVSYIIFKTKKVKRGKGIIKGLPLSWQFLKDRNGNIEIIDYTIFCPKCDVELINEQSTTGWFWHCPNCGAKSPTDFNYLSPSEIKVLIKDIIKRKECLKYI